MRRLPRIRVLEEAPTAALKSLNQNVRRSVRKSPGRDGGHHHDRGKHREKKETAARETDEKFLRGRKICNHVRDRLPHSSISMVLKNRTRNPEIVSLGDGPLEKKSSTSSIALLPYRSTKRGRREEEGGGNTIRC